MKNEMTINCMQNIIRHKLNFEEDSIWLYIVDRQLNLHRKLATKSDISEYILYEKKISLKDIIEYDDKLHITYNSTYIKYNNTKHPTLGNIVIYNETIDCIMSFCELSKDIFLEDEQEDSTIKKGIDSLIDFIYDFPPDYIKNAYIGNIEYIFDNIFNDDDIF